MAHPKAILGALSTIALVSVLLRRAFGTDNLRDNGYGEHGQLHAAIPRFNNLDLPSRVSTMGLCASERSLDHTHMMEQVFPPRYEDVLRIITSTPSGTWLQIGANTLSGTDTNDPLLKWLDILPGLWVKVFVEPIPALFAKLEKSVSRWPNATAVNVAIAPSADVPRAQADMYCLMNAFQDKEGIEKGKENIGGGKASHREPAFEDGELLPHWADQICSFDKKHIDKHFPNRVTNSATVSVTALSVPELLRQQDIQKLDVLMVDTEGFDFQVLQQIPFESFRPRLIVYEHIHLSNADQEAAKNFLRRHCYVVSRFDDANHAAVALFV